jgi:hypothetical protein
MASPVLSQQPLRICLSLPLANTEGETQAVIKVAFFQLVLIRLPFIRSEVTTNVEHPFGRYGDGIVGNLTVRSEKKRSTISLKMASSAPSAPCPLCYKTSLLEYGILSWMAILSSTGTMGSCCPPTQRSMPSLLRTASRSCTASFP